MNLFENLHDHFILDRRARVLGAHLAAAIEAGPLKVLDVGCGDGRVTAMLQRLRPDIGVHGIETQSRHGAFVPTRLYDGRLPYNAGEFDVVLLVDVLHHAADPLDLLTEARRVARQAVIIKDHLREGPLAGARLRFMDQVGNRRFGVPLPFNYWTRSQWREAFHRLELEPRLWRESLGLYVWPLRPIFDGTLHFLARCAVPAKLLRREKNARVVAPGQRGERLECNNDGVNQVR